MASSYETFFDHDRFAVVGHSQAKPFPLLSYRGLKRLGKTVYPIDPSSALIDGDTAYPSLDALPGPIEALIIEVPRAETRDWVEAAARAGLRDVWIHMGHDTPEAVALAETSGIELRTGTCAVMYLNPGLSYHSIHKAIMKLAGKY
ncbi:CoA-binding protein [Thiocystis violacea]|uniref:CoA-binding protein n=1 Tax=Thiocystis violacea TaxID=13725 RepID=UPI0019075BB1|nr:CoA-binding protein [Thiocystis violacea]MBK1722851.1 CoA-binding protein [Thiocystis violacea]